MATNRIIRTNRTPAAPAASAPRQSAPPPLRTASRTVMPASPPRPERHTTLSHHQAHAVVSESVQDESLYDAGIPQGSAFGSIKVGNGKTVNTGNYSAVRIDVEVTLPFLPGEHEAAYLEASDFVHEKLAEEETYVLGAVAPTRSANRRG